MWFDSLVGVPLSLGRLNTAAPASTNLSSAFTYNSAGASIAYRFLAPRSLPLTDVYVYCSAVVGSPTALTAELRSYSSSTKPGATVHATAVASAVGLSGKWLRLTFASPFTCVAGVPYYLILYNATASPASNYASVNHQGAITNVDTVAGTFRTLTTTNGWSTATSVTNPGVTVLRFNDSGESYLVGCPLTSIPIVAMTGQQRGLRLPPLDAPLELFAVNAPLLAGVTALHVLKDSSPPGATPGSGELGVSLAAGVADMSTIVFDPFPLRRGVGYRVVFTFGAISDQPGYYQIDDAASHADVPACGLAGIQWTEESAGAWVDSSDRLPRMQLWLRRTPPTLRRVWP